MGAASGFQPDAALKEVQRLEVEQQSAIESNESTEATRQDGSPQRGQKQS